jgi:hypothetical protein
LETISYNRASKLKSYLDIKIKYFLGITQGNRYTNKDNGFGQGSRGDISIYRLKINDFDSIFTDDIDRKSVNNENSDNGP